VIGDTGPSFWDLGREKVLHWRSPLVGRRREDPLVGVHLLPFSKTFRREGGCLGLLKTMSLATYVLWTWNSWLVTNLTSTWHKCLTPDECIDQLTLSSSQGYFEITAPICMYAMGYSFLLQGWTIMSFFKKFYRMVGLEPTINVFKICYVGSLVLMVATVVGATSGALTSCSCLLRRYCYWEGKSLKFNHKIMIKV